MTINKEFDPLGDKLTCALYRTFIRFKIARDYRAMWNPNANGGRGQEYRQFI